MIGEASNEKSQRARAATQIAIWTQIGSWEGPLREYAIAATTNTTERSTSDLDRRLKFFRWEVSALIDRKVLDVKETGQTHVDLLNEIFFEDLGFRRQSGPAALETVIAKRLAPPALLSMLYGWVAELFNSSCQAFDVRTQFARIEIVHGVPSEVVRLIPLNDDGRISAVVGYVSDILKYSLTNPQKSVSLREELDYLKKYVEVQHYRFGDSFIIYYEVDDDVMDAEVFRLMLRPVVENSLLHALRGNERGYMKVRARRIGDKVNLRVIDNGDGMTREELEALRKRIADRNSRSIGLTNLDRRLRLRYPEETGLRICSIKNLGTSVSFCIPYKKYTPDAPQTGTTE